MPMPSPGQGQAATFLLPWTDGRSFQALAHDKFLQLLADPVLCHPELGSRLQLVLWEDLQKQSLYFRSAAATAAAAAAAAASSSTSKPSTPASGNVNARAGEISAGEGRSGDASGSANVKSSSSSRNSDKAGIPSTDAPSSQSHSHSYSHSHVGRPPSQAPTPHGTPAPLFKAPLPSISRPASSASNPPRSAILPFTSFSSGLVPQRGFQPPRGTEGPEASFVGGPATPGVFYINNNNNNEQSMPASAPPSTLHFIPPISNRASRPMYHHHPPTPSFLPASLAALQEAQTQAAHSHAHAQSSATTALRPAPSVHDLYPALRQSSASLPGSFTQVTPGGGGGGFLTSFLPPLPRSISHGSTTANALERPGPTHRQSGPDRIITDKGGQAANDARSSGAGLPVRPQSRSASTPSISAAVPARPRHGQVMNRHVGSLDNDTTSGVPSTWSPHYVFAKIATVGPDSALVRPEEDQTVSGSSSATGTSSMGLAAHTPAAAREQCGPPQKRKRPAPGRTGKTSPIRCRDGKGKQREDQATVPEGPSASPAGTISDPTRADDSTGSGGGTSSGRIGGSQSNMPPNMPLRMAPVANTSAAVADAQLHPGPFSSTSTPSAAGGSMSPYSSYPLSTPYMPNTPMQPVAASTGSATGQMPSGRMIPSQPSMPTPSNLRDAPPRPRTGDTSRSAGATNVAAHASATSAARAGFSLPFSHPIRFPQASAPQQTASEMHRHPGNYVPLSASVPSSFPSATPTGGNYPHGQHNQLFYSGSSAPSGGAAKRGYDLPPVLMPAHLHPLYRSQHPAEASSCMPSSADSQSAQASSAVVNPLALLREPPRAAAATATSVLAKHQLAHSVRRRRGSSGSESLSSLSPIDSSASQSSPALPTSRSRPVPETSSDMPQREKEESRAKDDEAPQAPETAARPRRFPARSNRTKKRPYAEDGLSDPEGEYIPRGQLARAGQASTETSGAAVGQGESAVGKAESTAGSKGKKSKRGTHASAGSCVSPAKPAKSARGPAKRSNNKPGADGPLRSMPIADTSQMALTGAVDSQPAPASKPVVSGLVGAWLDVADLPAHPGNGTGINGSGGDPQIVGSDSNAAEGDGGETSSESEGDPSSDREEGSDEIYAGATSADYAFS